MHVCIHAYASLCECVCVPVHVCTTAQVCRSEDSCQSQFSPTTWELRSLHLAANACLYLLSHLTGLCYVTFIGDKILNENWIRLLACGLHDHPPHTAFSLSPVEALGSAMHSALTSLGDVVRSRLSSAPVAAPCLGQPYEKY